jgi:TolA-binding protein
MIFVPITLDPLWFLRRKPEPPAPTPEPPAPGYDVLAQIGRLEKRLDTADGEISDLTRRLELQATANEGLIAANIEQARQIQGFGTTLDRERLEGRLGEAETGSKAQGVRIRKLEQDHAALQAQYDLALRDLTAQRRRAEYWVAVAIMVDKSYQEATGKASLIDTEQAARVSALIDEGGAG